MQKRHESYGATWSWHDISGMSAYAAWPTPMTGRHAYGRNWESIGRTRGEHGQSHVGPQRPMSEHEKLPNDPTCHLLIGRGRGSFNCRHRQFWPAVGNEWKGDGGSFASTNRKRGYNQISSFVLINCTCKISFYLALISNQRLNWWLQYNHDSSMLGYMPSLSACCGRHELELTYTHNTHGNYINNIHTRFW